MIREGTEKKMQNIQTTQEKMTIDYRFKILYALGMIFVVTGHCRGGGISFFYEWFPVKGFHLGLFMFCSGYFYKTEAEENLLGYIWKKIKHLIIPLYIYNFIYAIIIRLLSFKGFTIGTDITLQKLLVSTITDGHQLRYTLAGWFLVPLFMVEVYNVLFRKILQRFSISEWIYFVINLFLGICGVSLASLGYNQDWWLVLVRMLYFLPFYSLGIFYKNTLEKTDVIPGIAYFSLIFMAKLIIVYICGRMPIYTPSYCNDFIDGPLMPYISGFLGIAFWLRIAKITEPVIGRNKYINLIADHTYSIMMNQFMGFMLVKAGFALFHKYTGYCKDFNLLQFKSDIWYLYTPRNIEYMLILYLAAGIIFPILIQLCINHIKDYVLKFLNKHFL